MRKITKQALNVFLNDDQRYFNKSNTTVFFSHLPNSLNKFLLKENIISESQQDKLYKSLQLYDSIIAIRFKDKYNNNLFGINHCGFKTVTTKERLNNLPYVHIFEKNAKWFVKDIGHLICCEENNYDSSNIFLNTFEWGYGWIIYNL